MDRIQKSLRKFLRSFYGWIWVIAMLNFGNFEFKFEFEKTKFKNFEFFFKICERNKTEIGHRLNGQKLMKFYLLYCLSTWHYGNDHKMLYKTVIFQQFL